MQELKAVGHGFTLFTFGLPGEKTQAIIERYRELVDVFEIILPWQDATTHLPALQAVKKRISVPLYISKLLSSADEKHEGSKFSHNVEHGFQIDEREQIASFMNESKASDIIDGVVFRIAYDQSPWLDFQSIHQICHDLDIQASVHVRLAAENMALDNKDDRKIANLVAETVFSTHVFSDLRVFIDTFMDIDRGYFLRHGLVDRRFNPRLAGNVFRFLSRSLSDVQNTARADIISSNDGGRFFSLNDEKGVYGLITSTGDAVIRIAELVPEKEMKGSSGMGEWVDLDTGDIIPIIWEKIQTENIHQVRFEPDLASRTPSFISVYH